MEKGFVDLTVLVESLAEILLRDGVIGGDRERVRPELLAVPPKRSLRARHPGERNQGGESEPRENNPKRARSTSQLRDSPSNHENDTDLRKISVTVRVRLVADLHDSNHRPEHDQEPQPSRDRITAPSDEKDDERDCCQDRSGDSDAGQMNPRRVPRIKDGQIYGPESLAQIIDISDEGVTQAQKQGEPFDRLDGGVLSENCHEARGQAEHDEGQFLDDESTQRRPRLFKTTERPIIEQKEDERHADQHRLGHQTEREDRQDNGITAEAATAHITDVGRDRQNEKETAQYVLPLRHPRHRFDVQRMDRENRGHESAPPERARHLPEDKKEQRRGQGMNEDVGEMMAGWIEAVELRIHHVRNPGERMPVAGMDMAERPPDSIPTEPAIDPRVFEDVIAVVEIDEVVAERLSEDEPDECPEKDNNAERQPAIAGGNNRFCLVQVHAQPELWTGK